MRNCQITPQEIKSFLEEHFDHKGWYVIKRSSGAKVFYWSVFATSTADYREDSVSLGGIEAKPPEEPEAESEAQDG